MGRSNRFPGLKARGGQYWLDIDNRRYGRIYESTGCSTKNPDQRDLAEAYYTRRVNEVTEQRIFGVRPRRLWRDAATKHLKEETGVLDSIGVDACALSWADPYIGDKPVDNVHDETLEKMKAAMRLKGLKGKTVNTYLEVVRKVLNKCARVWRDGETGKTWLETAPLISMVPTDDSRPPYPVSWDEERKLILPELPGHLEEMALFDINCGARENEVCSLRWPWERRVPELDTPDFKVSVFLVPKEFTKAKRERLIVLNKIAAGIIERQRGKHPEFVFTYEGDPITRMNNTAWDNARGRWADKYEEAFKVKCPSGMRTLHVHDLRHTFGRRLRAAGVSKETRADLLGHAADEDDVTSHYSAAEIRELVDAVRLIEVPMGSAPTLTVLRTQAA